MYVGRAVEKCPRWNFYTPKKPINSINKSGNSFCGHPVVLKDFQFEKMNVFGFDCITYLTQPTPMHL